MLIFNTEVKIKVSNYDSSVERLILISLITDKSVLAQVSSIYQNDMMSCPGANLITSWCVKYFKKYGKAPKKHLRPIFTSWAERSKDKNTIDYIGVVLENLSTEYIQGEEQNSQYMIDLASKHLNKVRIEKTLQLVEGEILSGNVETALEKIQSFKRVEIGQGTVIDLLNDPKVVENIFSEKSQSIVLYPESPIQEFFDDTLSRSNFVAFIAPEKKGKSIWLLDLAYRSTQQRSRTLYIQVGDLSERDIQKRFAVRFAKRSKDKKVYKYPLSIERSSGQDEAEVVHEERQHDEYISAEEVTTAFAKFSNRLKSNSPMIKLSCHTNMSISAVGVKSIIQKQIDDGWVPDVVCIAEGSLVLTNHGLIPIEKVTTNDKVWDGLNWVNHGGPIYRGIKEVITYEGLTATPEHLVHTRSGWKHFITSKRMGLQNTKTGIGRKEIWIGKNNFGNCESENCWKEQKGSCELCLYPMYKLWIEKMDFFKGYSKRNNSRMQEMFKTKKISNLVVEEIGMCSIKMPKPQKSFLEELWREGDKIPLSICQRCLFMDSKKLNEQQTRRILSFANRSNKQRRSLRTRKFEDVYLKAEHGSYQTFKYCYEDSQISSDLFLQDLFRQNINDAFPKRTNPRRDSTEMEQEQKLLKKPVWDILNCGPLHRFTVQGFLVHNCVDYADNLMPITSQREKRHEINDTWSTLRAISLEFNVLLVSASQADSKSYNKKVLDMSNFSESKTKNAHSSALIGINQTDNEKENEVFRLNYILRREGSYLSNKCVHVSGARAINAPAIGKLSTW